MGASLRETGSREPNPQAVSALTGFDPARGFVLTGYVEEVHSKSGIRFVKFGADAPYEHSVWIDVEGDEHRRDDDSLTEDLYPHCGRRVSVRVTVGAHRTLVATPSCFTAIAEGEPARGESPHNQSNPKVGA